MSRAVLRLGRYEEALMWLHRAQELLAQQHHHMTHKEEQKQPEGEKSEKEVWKNFRGQLHDRKQEIVRMQVGGRCFCKVQWDVSRSDISSLFSLFAFPAKNHI